jgi:hypothetical protein
MSREIMAPYIVHPDVGFRMKITALATSPDLQNGLVSRKLL